MAYIELKDKKIVSLWDTKDINIVLQNTEGIVMDIGDTEYNLLRACHSNIKSGINTLRSLSERIKKYYDANEDTQNE